MRGRGRLEGAVFEEGFEECVRVGEGKGVCWCRSGWWRCCGGGRCEWGVVGFFLMKWMEEEDDDQRR